MSNILGAYPGSKLVIQMLSSSPHNAAREPCELHPIPPHAGFPNPEVLNERVGGGGGGGRVILAIGIRVV